jgi:hypothetical protein
LGGEIAYALESGAAAARRLLAEGLIDGAALRLQGEMAVVAAKALEIPISRVSCGSPAESAVHA